MSFTFRQLEIFVESAQDANFRKTADRIGISQPAISKQIKALEASIGASLFNRTRGATARLSAAGESLLAEAKEMLARRRGFESTKNAGAPMTLKIATGDYLLDQRIKPALASFLALSPNLMLEFHPAGDQLHMAERIRSGELDMAIFTGQAPLFDDPPGEIIAIVPCSLYASRDIARSVGGDIDAISAAPFLLPPDPSPQTIWFRQMLAQAGIFPSHITARSQFGDVLAGLVRAGKGISILFDEYADRHGAGELIRLPVSIGPACRVMICGEKTRSPAAAPFLRMLRDILKNS